MTMQDLIGAVAKADAAAVEANGGGRPDEIIAANAALTEARGTLSAALAASGPVYVENADSISVFSHSPFIPGYTAYIAHPANTVPIGT